MNFKILKTKQNKIKNAQKDVSYNFFKSQGWKHLLNCKIRMSLPHIAVKNGESWAN